MGLQRLVSLRRSNQGRAPNRFEFSAFDTWVQKDEILIRDGILILNLLNGAPENGAGGQPRHQIDWSALVYTDGLGAGLNGTWRSATSVAGRDAIAPDYLDLTGRTVWLTVRKSFQ